MNNEGLTLTCKINFGVGMRKRKQIISGIPKPRKHHPDIPRIARQMALAIVLEDLLRKGQAKDYAGLARLAGIDRSAISRLMNLRLLAPEIQEALLGLNGKNAISLKHLLPISRIANWEMQDGSNRWI